jgi:hypothetical protein
MSSTRNIIIALAIFTLLVVGIVIFAFFSSSEKSYVQEDTVNIKPDESKTLNFQIYNIYDFAATFSVSNGTIMTCDPLNYVDYASWKEDPSSLSWYEASQHEYNYNKESYPEDSPWIYDIYFLFRNQDSYEKNVHVQVTAYRTEPNTTNITIASTLIVSGLVIGIGLIAISFKKKTHAQYDSSMPVALLDN